LSIDIDLTAIIVMESFGVVSFIVAFLFFKRLQRISDKRKGFLNALNRGLISERGDGKCFSSEWAMDNIVYKRRKLWNATPLFMATLSLGMAFFYYLVGPRIIANIVGFGYATVIALLGVSILLWTDAFEAYQYTQAIRMVPADQLDKEDQSYIELAKAALEKAFLRFLSLGFAFTITGPFIPQIFNGVLYAFSFYTTALFQTSEASFKGSAIFGIVLIVVLPALMMFLPEFLGRIVIRKGKWLTSKVFKRRG